MSIASWKRCQIGIVALTGTPPVDHELVNRELAMTLASEGIRAMFAGIDPALCDLAVAVNRHGGKAICIGDPDQYGPGAPVFDAVMNTAHVRHLLVSSCAGVIAIASSTPPTSSEIGPIMDLPVAVLTGASADQPDNQTTQQRTRRFRTPREAIAWILSESCQDVAADVEYLMQNGHAISRQNYPHGEGGEYLAAAQFFHAASLTALGHGDMDGSLARMSYLTASADHLYYHVEDFFGAAALYREASVLAKQLLDNGYQDILKRYWYLQAIMFESLALGLAGVAEDELGRTLALESIQRYKQASVHASSTSLPCYLHTMAGLAGWAHLLQSRREAAKGNVQIAEELLRVAREGFDEALRQQPQWARSGFSDQYSRTVLEYEDTARYIASCRTRVQAEERDV